MIKRIILSSLIAAGIGIFYSIFEINIIFWINNDANAYSRIIPLYLYSILLYSILFVLINFFILILYNILINRKKKQFTKKGVYIRWMVLFLLVACYIPIGFFINNDILPDLFSLLSFIGNVILIGIFIFLFIVINKRISACVSFFSLLLKRLFAILTITAIICISVSSVLATRKTRSLKLTAKSLHGNESPNIILIVIDTLRSDFLSCYGYPKKITPNIDKIAQKSILFEKAYASSPWTFTSMASMLTSLNSYAHNVDGFESVLDDSFITLPEILKKQDYYTYAFIGNPTIEEQMGFAQGFDYYDNYGFTIENRMIINRAVSILIKQANIIHESYLRALWVLSIKVSDHSLFFKRTIYVDAEDLNKRIFSILPHIPKRKCFLYIHYLDPHAPYFSHSKRLLKEPKLIPENISKIVSAYESEVRYVDYHIGQLLQKLNEYDLITNSIIIITSDHGEEFYEHKDWHHGWKLYNESILVPLIINLPQTDFKHEKISYPVSIIDIMPTIISQINKADNNIQSQMQGKDLTELLNNTMEEERYFYFENKLRKNKQGQVKRGICSDRFKLIKNQDFKMKKIDFELYQIEADFGEKYKLTIDDYSEAKALLAILKEYEKLDRLSTTTPKKMRKELERKLKAFGYIND